MPPLKGKKSFPIVSLSSILKMFEALLKGEKTQKTVNLIDECQTLDSLLRRFRGPLIFSFPVCLFRLILNEASELMLMDLKKEDLT